MGLTPGVVILVLLFASSTSAQGIEWRGPRQTPGELAKVLSRCTCLTNVANRPDLLPREPGPQVIVMSGRAEDGPYGPFPPYQPIAPLSHSFTETYINGYGPVSQQGLENFAVGSAILGTLPRYWEAPAMSAATSGRYP